MIDKLLGTLVFEESKKLSPIEIQQEIALEEKHLALFTANSPVNNAGSIGRHLSNFSKKIDSLPSHLCFIDNWIIDTYEVRINEKPKWKRVNHDDLKLYLLHKVFQKKVVFNQVYSDNQEVQKQVLWIKSNSEIYHLQGSIKKHLGNDVTIKELFSLSGQEISNIIKRLKGDEGELNGN